MQPHNPTKPVMDVSAPRPTQPSVATPVAPKPAPLPVQPAPTPAAPIAAAIPHTEQSTPAPAAKRSPSGQKSTAPVGIITATVLVMMFMSVMAVVVYMTSKS